MEIRFIGQGYNVDKNTSVAEVLMVSLADKRFTKFTCLVAFASKAGVSALSPHVENAKNHLESIRIIVGVDQKATSKDALEELLTWGVEAFVYHTTQRNIFHPKIYLFESDTNVLLIIGSNNLTQMGLVQNVESSVAISFDRGDSSGEELLNEVYSYYTPIIEGTDTNLKLLTSELISSLQSKGIIPTEAERRSLYIKLEKTEEDNQEQDTVEPPLFGKAKIQKLPKGFAPKRTKETINNILSPEEESSPEIAYEETVEITHEIVHEEPAEIAHEEQTGIADQTTANPLFNNENTVLIAELSGPSRWKQANFDRGTFENFFGATAGDNNYNITLEHVTDEGQLEQQEISQAVSVQSSNYRFELRAATGTYPDPTEGKPIAVFIRLSSNQFIYKLLKPDSVFYPEINNYLNSIYTGRLDRMRRVQITVEDLRLNCPDFPLLLTNN